MITICIDRVAISTIEISAKNLFSFFGIVFDCIGQRNENAMVKSLNISHVNGVSVFVFHAVNTDMGMRSATVIDTHVVFIHELFNRDRPFAGVNLAESFAEAYAIAVVI